MSWFSEFFGGLFGGGGDGDDEEQGIQTMSTLSPEQQELMTSLTPYLKSRIGKGLPEYTGQFVAGESPYEQAALSRLQGYLTGTPDIQSFGLGQYRNALAGMSPTETASWYNQYIMPEQKRIQEEVIIPGVREAYAGPLSAYYSEPRMGAEARSWNQFGTTQQSLLGSAIMQEREGARSMIPYLSEMSGLQGGLPQIEAGMTYGALPRVLQQAQLSAKFEEFKRTTPELSPVIDQILQLLNITTTAGFAPGAEATQGSPFMQLLSAVGPGVGAYFGSRANTPQTMAG